MPFDMKNLSPPTRFYWPGDPTGEEWVEFRLVPERDRLATVKDVGIDRKAEFVINSKSKAMERVEYVSTDLAKGEEFLGRLNDLAIPDWFLKAPAKDGKPGKPIPCTKENKTLLFTGSEQFARWAEKCLEILGDAQKSMEKQLAKNGLSSQKG
ncbi:hypothetical protein KAR91_43085 [Candidatus Pacearchaeota archaeon]|nr:hypothetical protein [Candidatus Pacearchaeota archaeon]